MNDQHRLSPMPAGKKSGWGPSIIPSGTLKFRLALTPIDEEVQGELTLTPIEVSRMLMGPTPLGQDQAAVLNHLRAREDRRVLVDNILVGLRDRMLATLDEVVSKS